MLECGDVGVAVVGKLGAEISDGSFEGGLFGFQVVVFNAGFLQEAIRAPKLVGKADFIMVEIAVLVAERFIGSLAHLSPLLVVFDCRSQKVLLCQPKLFASSGFIKPALQVLDGGWLLQVVNVD